MAEAYYPPTPATDGATMNPVPGAEFQVFEIEDTAFSTPLSLRVGSGNATTTVTASDGLAVLPGVHVTSPNFEHVWKSGSFEWRRDSIDGAKAAVEAAKVAASDAATNAAAAAEADLAARIAAGEFQGPAGRDGSNVVPTSEAIAIEIETPGTRARTALTTTIDDSLPLGPVSFPRKPNYEMLDIFQSGHTWTTTGASTGATAFAADTADYILGTQSLKGVTAGGVTQVRVEKKGMAPLNLTGKSMAVLLKVDNIDNLDGIPALIGDSNFANYRSVRLMPAWEGTGASAPGWSGTYQWFHGELTDTLTTVGTPNMSAVTDIRVMAYDHGTPLTVNLQAVAFYTKPTAYPNGVVSITWDDNLLSQYTLARRAFDKWGDGATAYVIVDKLGVSAADDNGAGGRFSVAQAHELENMHGWEIGGHAYTQAKHDVSASNTLAELETELIGLKGFLRREGFRGADGYAWPQGNNNPEKAALVGKYFSHARHTGGTYAPLLLDKPMRVQAMNLTSDVTVATYQSRIDHVKTHGKHLILMGHQVRESGASGNTNINLADLQAIIDYCHTAGVPIRTMGQVFRETGR